MSIQKLTDKQKVFIEAYLRCLNATQAAREAGYSETSLRQIAHETLSKHYIRAEIDRRLAEQTMPATETLTRLALQARNEASAYLDEDGRVDIAALVNDGLQHLVKKIKFGKSGDWVEVEFYDAQSALQLIGRTQGLFVDKTALTDPTGEKEYAGLPDDERIERIATLLDRAGTRRAGPSPDSAGEDETD
jgi:phage terminase small subunit